MPRKRAFVSLIVAGLASAAIAVSAQADIDPASDVLLQQDVFLPYQPKVCPQLSKALEGFTADTRKAGYPLQVVLIGSPSDLGGVSDMFGDPERYARFLGEELVAAQPEQASGHPPGAARPKQGSHPLLVVMPGGFGVFQAGPKAERALEGLSVPAEAPPDRLARAALTAAPRLARAADVSVPAPKADAGCSDSSGGSAVLVIAAPLVLLVIAGVIAASRRFRPGAADDRA